MFTKRWLTILAGMVLLFAVALLSGTAVSHAADSSWTAKYWDNRTLSGDPVLTRSESNLDHNWGHGVPNGVNVNKDAFSARWTRTINVSGGSYRFTATMDDGMRVWVDGVLIIDSWWDSQEHSMSADVYLNAGDHQVKVEYYEAGGVALARLTYGPSGTGTILHWRGEYFNNTSLAGAPALVRDDVDVNFNWGSGSPAWSTISADQFSARWTRNIWVDGGRYRFTVTSDDGVRLWVNNQLVIDKWFQHAAQTYTADVDLAGSVPVRLEYFEAGGLASVQLSWAQVGQPTSPPPGTGGAYTAFVNTAYLNVRQGPGVSYGVITAAPRNTAVTLTHRNADASWVRVILPNGTRGWMSAAYLASNLKPFTFLPLWSGSDGQSSAPTATVVNCHYLNVRSGPGVGYGVRTIVARNMVVTLAGYRNANASWVKVTLPNGTPGWVNASYLNSSFPFTNLAVGGF